jgi:hypothetical protein
VQILNSEALLAATKDITLPDIRPGDVVQIRFVSSLKYHKLFCTYVTNFDLKSSTCFSSDFSFFVLLRVYQSCGCAGGLKFTWVGYIYSFVVYEIMLKISIWKLLCA